MRGGRDVDVRNTEQLLPLDLRAIARSVAKTGRLVTLEDAPITHGFGAEVVARVSEHAFGALRSAPRRVAGADVPIPHALEGRCLPDVPAIVDAVRATVRG